MSMVKHIGTVAGLGLAVAFVVVFFIGRTESKQLVDVAPKVGMSHEDLLAMGPRVASQTGATLGSSRRVVYLLACSGMSSRDALEAQATRAGSLARKDRLTDREAVIAILAQNNSGPGVADKLKDC
jgi:hypothetical protein